MKVAVLSGGVGGARFVQGVVATGEDVSVIGNVGDDVEVLGLHVSPDLDSIMYALAGLNDEKRGWGRAGEETGKGVVDLDFLLRIAVAAGRQAAEACRSRAWESRDLAELEAAIKRSAV